jgi:hypothetical protein
MHFKKKNQKVIDMIDGFYTDEEIENFTKDLEDDPAIEDVQCQHEYRYFGHDHNRDYEKCIKCGHFREQE